MVELAIWIFKQGLYHGVVIKRPICIVEETCSNFSHGFNFNQRSAPNSGCCSVWECGTQLEFKWSEWELQKCSNTDVGDPAQFLVINHLSLGITPLLVSHMVDVCGNKMADERDTQLPFMFCTGSLWDSEAWLLLKPGMNGKTWRTTMASKGNFYYKVLSHLAQLVVTSLRATVRTGYRNQFSYISHFISPGSNNDVQASSQMVHDPSGLAIHYLSLGWSWWDLMLHTHSLPPESSITVADHWYQESL